MKPVSSTACRFSPVCPFDVIDLYNETDNELGFLFIGRGSQFQKMRNIASEKSISNVLFYDQIENKKIMSLYRQCHYGIVILDRRHKTHNIPGKLLSYLHAGLPVFALVNPKNDLISFSEL